MNDSACPFRRICLSEGRCIDECEQVEEFLDEVICPECGSGPGEEHSIHCSIEYGP